MTRLLAVLLPLTAFAANNDVGQRNAEEEVLPKLKLLCGQPFTSTYDLASLKAKNKDIGWDQTSGALECDEPLRLLWALCQSDSGKATVRRAELRGVQCRGIEGTTGKLSVKNGLITVERAYEESNPWERAQAEFQAALKLKEPVALSSPDPYYDEAWREFRRAPTPVTSTTDFCVVNGQKVKFDLQVAYSPRDGAVKCVEGGKTVVDLTIKNGKQSGLTRSTRDDWYRSERYVDGKREGLTEEYKANKLTRQDQYAAGERVWSKEFTSSGALRDYSRQFPKGQVTLRLTDDGRVTSLTCRPEARGDEVLNEWCGFKGDRVVKVYDGTNKVSAVRTFRDGRLTREEPGDSTYASRRSVTFDADGKKQGEERVLRADGTLDSVTRWKAGEQDGVEELYSKDGAKVVTRATWKAGTRVDRTEYFLNGNKKLSEAFDGDVMTRTTWFDLGAKESEARFKRCQRYSGWCEDGATRRWFENGKPAEESAWRMGQQHGVTKRWFANGTQESEERWDDGNRRARKQWDDKGALVADDEFEEDGSRKVKR